MNNKCPLTGQPCNKHKCIHITDVSPNYSSENELHLCEQCGTDFIDKDSMEKKPTSPISTFFELLELIMKQKIKIQAQKVAAEPLVPDSNPCSMCGCVIQDIINSSRLGCPGCYDHFKEQLLPVLQNAHKAIRHVGKVPKHFKLIPPDNVEELEVLMAKLISEEKYEEAVIIRDKIKILKS